MIEFSGCLSHKCQKYILYKEAKIGLIAGITTASIFSIPAMILAIKVNFIFIICLPAFLIFGLLAGMPPNKKNYNFIMPSNIIINLNSGTIISKSEKFYLERAISEIVSVNDMGDWYHICFGDKIDRLGRFVCQKDLIRGCTVDEFEKIFVNKIVRK